jgi:colanic acid/amylovoran biosynthesis glycosyltransferase
MIKMTISVAYVVKRFPVLSETFILDQITGLIDRGCHVDILAKRPERTPVLHPKVNKYNLLGRTVFFWGP